MTVCDVLALLVNADPQGEIRWPKNKTEGLQRVRGLPTVQAALQRHSVAAHAALAAAAGVPAAQTPSTPPEPSMHLHGSSEETRRPSVGSSNAVHEVPVPPCVSAVPGTSTQLVF